MQRLEEIFEDLEASPKGKKRKAMEGLIAEGKELLKEDAEEQVLDAGLISTGQKVEHYEMVGYGSVRAYAQMLGDQRAATMLQQTLDEEGETDKKLTAIAESAIDPEAAQAEPTNGERNGPFPKRRSKAAR